MKAELICMMEKFPGLREKILAVYDSNDKFQALCYDYLLCLKSLSKWETYKQSDEKFIKEYEELKKNVRVGITSFHQGKARQINSCHSLYPK